MTNDAKRYEIAYVLRPSLDETGVKTAMDAVLTLIADHKGIVDATDEPVRTHLGYPILGTRDSHVGSIRFTVAPELINDIRIKALTVSGVVRVTVLSWAKDIERAHRAVRTFTGDRKEETPAESTEAIDAQLSEALSDESLKHA